MVLQPDSVGNHQTSQKESSTLQRQCPGPVGFCSPRHERKQDLNLSFPLVGDTRVEIAPDSLLEGGDELSDELEPSALLISGQLRCETHDPVEGGQSGEEFLARFAILCILSAVLGAGTVLLKQFGKADNVISLGGGST